MAARKKPGISRRDAPWLQAGASAQGRRRAPGAGAQGRRRKAGSASVNGAAPGSTGPGPAQLEKQREKLSRQFAELQWDLGGIAYEMASRDHFRLDVLNKHAARLQQVDAELGQIEHLLKLDQAGRGRAAARPAGRFRRAAPSSAGSAATRSSPRPTRPRQRLRRSRRTRKPPRGESGRTVRAVRGAARDRSALLRQLRRPGGAADGDALHARGPCRGARRIRFLGRAADADPDGRDVRRAGARLRCDRRHRAQPEHRRHDRLRSRGRPGRAAAGARARARAGAVWGRGRGARHLACDRRLDRLLRLELVPGTGGGGGGGGKKKKPKKEKPTYVSGSSSI